MDVSKELDWSTSVTAVIEQYGRIDVLVNNAGVAGSSVPLDETTLENYLGVISVNQTGCFLGMREVIPHMKCQKRGSIINISSIAGMGGAPGRVAYQASKWAIRGMTRCAALECAPFNVRVNSIVPGWVDTQMAANAIVPRDQLAAGIPFGRLAEPSEISSLVSFLASDESTYVTGADLVIDGGVRARI
jgi:NAD(P)-dependent dehydrogenase (short-subunit alcohol dehydrogenase family)